MDSGQQRVDPVAEGLARIKCYMPKTYAAIKEQANGPRGSAAYALVRRSLRGEANCFYSAEGGHVVGAPFDRTDFTDQVAGLMVRFGFELIVIWGESADGTH